jgi:hypothetical protein
VKKPQEISLRRKRVAQPAAKPANRRNGETLSRLAKLFELRSQHKNPPPAVFVSGPFLLGQIVEIPAYDGFHLPVEQLWKLARNLLKPSGVHA